ncbi:hypothetical protein CF15_07425 [Pyrodictium occultum]|uniref:Ribbon-helix-helix protein CopG domain-containing protein n=1 Tax=Pyrodictium occultum TaxID=2309 RepID=A0A0V8RWU7_PYROC|nr:hypothetical protein [Pyrodictium occultum]KSW12542.1 hypothetical protein CF15_07425 [Pyrodictium occultum]
MPGRVVLPDSILRALEREAERRESTPEAVIVGMLLRLVEPGERPGALLDAARTSLEHARELAGEGRLGDAFRRVWASVLMALDALSLLRGGERPGGLAEYWRLVSEAMGELGAAADAWYAGLAAYIAWKEGIGDERHLEAMAGRAGRLVEELEARLGRG